MLKMQYYVNEIHGKKIISVFFSEKVYELLSVFLSSEVLAFEKWIKETMDKVLSGQSSYEELEGNICYVEVTPLQTNIYNALLKGEEYYSTCCEINTKELRELIEEWCTKVHEFRREQKIMQQFKECREKYLHFQEELEALYSRAKENAEDNSIYEKIGKLFKEWLDFSTNEYAAAIFQYGKEKKFLLKNNDVEERKQWEDVFGTEFDFLTKEKRRMLIDIIEKKSDYRILDEENMTKEAIENDQSSIINCIFCHKENITTDIVYEDSLVIAFMDMDPINEGHVLLVPKAHYLDVDELPDEILSHLMLVSKKIAAALKEIYHPDGYSIMQNGGKFNDVGHYHLHIFPRYHGDGFGWTYGEKEKKVNREIAEKIRGKIKQM